MPDSWQRQLAKTISRIENMDTEALVQLARCPLDNPNVHVIGVTGPPGGGKSTLCGQLVQNLAREHKVAALLVDPSSPYSGGAILGDRIRMSALSANPNVYIRSLSNRGNTGGVNSTVVSIIRAVMNCGFEYIIVETVGAGQSEVKIASIADTTLVVAVPNLGDDIQAFKSGIMEIADIFVINKADLPGADVLFAALRESAVRHKDGWLTPVCQTVAVEGRGIDSLLDYIRAHGDWLRRQGRLTEKRKQAAKFEILELSSYYLQSHLDQVPADVLAANLANKDFNMLQRLLDAYREIVNSLSEVN
ncbi:MAG: methylmalonyl Co-A mutase-associated GTPase MeaB [Firmicutes bacterium]|nr:methylmalonyl Co-A mutase-associated GTPase MeaB [Bacillota bacterium]